MDELLPLRDPPESRPPTGFAHAVRIHDPKTHQEVLLASAEPLELFALDDEERRWWGEHEAHPEAVVVAELEGNPIVVFIELTQSMRPRLKKTGGARALVDPMERKVRQLDAAARHFHPFGRTGAARTHGDEHHDRWRDGMDQPSVLPRTGHRVGGLVLGFHQTARTPVGPTTIGGVRVARAVWSPVPSTRGRAEIALADVARQLGWSG